MNLFLPSRYDELIHRLAVGIDPIDAVRRLRVRAPIEVSVEGPVEPERLLALYHQRKKIYELFERIPPHESCVHALLYRRELKESVVIRLHDRHRRHLPRRLRIPLAGLPTRDPARDLDDVKVQARTRRIAVFPDAAAHVPDAITGLRGRVVKRSTGPGPDVPLRWARVEAHRGGQRVGVAHGDARGEFLLLLDPAAVFEADLPEAPEVEVTVHTRPANLAPTPTWLPEVDPHWDLPLETLAGPHAPADPVADGEEFPTVYTATADARLPLTYGRIANHVNRPFKIP